MNKGDVIAAINNLGYEVSDGDVRERQPWRGRDIYVAAIGAIGSEAPLHYFIVDGNILREITAEEKKQMIMDVVQGEYRPE